MTWIKRILDEAERKAAADRRMREAAAEGLCLRCLMTDKREGAVYVLHVPTWLNETAAPDEKDARLTYCEPCLFEAFPRDTLAVALQFGLLRPFTWSENGDPIH